MGNGPHPATAPALQARHRLIIGSIAQSEQLKSTFGDRYQLLSSGLNEDGSYPLRPGVDLLLYVRRDVAR